jgi:type IV pilus assembly protein PilC
MPNFTYAALDAKGEQTTGALSANTEAEAIQQLRAQGLYPTQIMEEGKGKKGAKTVAPAKRNAQAKPKASKKNLGGSVKPKNLMIFTRQLATLIDSGLPLLRSLTVLEKQEPHPVLRATVSALAENVQGGSTFSESLAQHPRIFNKLYVNMVKAGELGGVLEIVLNRLAEYQEKAQKLKNKIVSAMVYPVIVMFIAVAILVFLMIFIVPKFKEMFANTDQDLPLISQIVFGTSEFFLARPLFVPNIVFVFILIGIGVFLFNLWGRTKGGRKSIDTLKLKMPVLGDIQRKSAVSRFSRTLGTLVTSGVPILQASTSPATPQATSSSPKPSKRSTRPSRKGKPSSPRCRPPASSPTWSFPWWTSARKPANSRKCSSRWPTSMTTRWTTPSPR